MSLESLRKEQESNADRTMILRLAQRRQDALEHAFWSQAFPLITRRIVDALHRRGITASWTPTTRDQRGDWHVLSIGGVGEILYVSVFPYRVDFDKSERLHLHYRYTPGYAERGLDFEDSLPADPPAVSFWINLSMSRWSLAPFSITGSPPDENKGAYRFRWYGERDTERIALKLLEVLDGRKPESDFKFRGCFIATAVFGEGALQLDTLRSFRDQYLEGNRSGRVFLSWYYSHSPQIASLIVRRPVLLASIRFVLDLFGRFAGTVTSKVSAESIKSCASKEHAKPTL